MALNRHFCRHFVLVCTRNSAISAVPYHQARMIPATSRPPVPRPGTGTAALYHSTPITPLPPPGPQGAVTPALSSLNIVNSSLKTLS
jgi:hypothetical protein